MREKERERAISTLADLTDKVTRKRGRERERDRKGKTLSSDYN